MAFSLKSLIFKKRFSYYDAIKDPNKGLDPQGDDRGTVQRYNEMLAEDFDQNTLPMLEDLVENNLEPMEALAKFLIYLEDRMGDPVVLGTGTYLRRRVLKYAVPLYQIRGTKRGYAVMFSMIGLVLDDLVENDPTGGFDLPSHTFDEPDHTFDSACPSCSSYEVHLSTMSGVSLTNELRRAIFNVIGFNEPINAVLAFVMLDGSLLVENIISVNVTSSGDLEYDDQYAPDTTLYLENDTDVQQHTLNGTPLPDGDLAIDSPDASHYSINSDGDLIYTP